MKRLVKATELERGDVVVTSTDQRRRIAEWQLCGDRVGLRLQCVGVDGRMDALVHRPFFVPLRTRFMREN